MSGPTQYDAPNQQAVRGDESHPSEEGNGGSPPVEGTGGAVAAEQQPAAADASETPPKGKAKTAAKADDEDAVEAE